MEKALLHYIRPGSSRPLGINEVDRMVCFEINLIYLRQFSRLLSTDWLADVQTWIQTFLSIRICRLFDVSEGLAKKANASLEWTSRVFELANMSNEYTILYKTLHYYGVLRVRLGSNYEDDDLWHYQLKRDYNFWTFSLELILSTWATNDAGAQAKRCASYYQKFDRHREMMAK